MSGLLDLLIADALQQAARRGLPGPEPWKPDPFERLAAYRGWVLPLRLALALRYMRRKSALLTEHRLAGRPPFPASDFRERLVRMLVPDRLDPPKRTIRLPWWVRMARTATLALVTVAIAAAAAGLYAYGRLPRSRLDVAFSRHLIHHSDLVHRREANRVLTRLSEALPAEARAEEWAVKGIEELRREAEAIDREIDLQRARIVAAIGPEPEIGAMIDGALRAPADPSKTGEQIVATFAQLNAKLEERRIPRQIVPTILSARCATFLTPKLASTVLAMEQIDPQRALGTCRTTLLVLYDVARRERYSVGNTEYPVYRVRRVEDMLVVEMALGLTYRSGIGSQVYVDRIRSYAIENVIPALDPRGRSLMFPQWTKGASQIEEDAADSVQRSLRLVYTSDQIDRLAAFAKDLGRYEHLASEARFRQFLLGMGHRTDVTDTSLLGVFGVDVVSGYLDRLRAQEAGKIGPRLAPPPEVALLEERIAHAIAVHEVRHQIRDRLPPGEAWRVEGWDPKALGSLEADQDGVLDEVSAYLVEIAHADKIRHVLLTQLTSFALSAAAKGREYYAARIILAAMEDSVKRPRIVPRVLADPIAIVSAYRGLRKIEDDQLGRVAGDVYAALFREPIPAIRLVR